MKKIRLICRSYKVRQPLYVKNIYKCNRMYPLLIIVQIVQIFPCLSVFVKPRLDTFYVTLEIASQYLRLVILATSFLRISYATLNLSRTFGNYCNTLLTCIYWYLYM